MLRAFLLSLTFIMWNSIIFAQKRDNVWMLGNEFHYLNYGLNFNSGQVDTFFLYRELNFTFTNASICDTSGELLFYTNGITIMNRNHDTLLNALNFNPGYYTNLYENIGLAIYSSSIIIPKPDSEYTKFLLIHESAEEVTVNNIQAPHPLELRMSEIDLSLDSALGGINPNKKNMSILADTLTLGRVSAVKHGNGRDWWVLCHRFNSDIFNEFLITPDSIVGPFHQTIGSFNPHYNFFGQSLFSNDGSKFVFQIDDTTINIYDFDRCSGLLSNTSTIIINDSNLALIGCSLSPSGKYLYVNNGKYIHQFDTWAGNISSTDQVVAQWDTFYSPGSTTFNTERLAPDGRIYIGTYVGTNILHYIQYPDSGGTACNVVQNSFVTPSYSTFSFPNSPNWDLGPSIGSTCDSLINYVGKNNEYDLGFEVYPNPTQNNFSLKSIGKIFKETSFVLYDNLGKEKIKSFLNSSSQNFEFDSGSLCTGIYFYLIQTPEKILKSGKLIIAK